MCKHGSNFTLTEQPQALALRANFCGASNHSLLSNFMVVYLELNSFFFLPVSLRVDKG